MSKKIQEKKSKKPTQLDRIEALARSAHAESGLAHAATLALQQRIDAMRHEQAALSQEARSAPAEEPLRVGDYVYLTREHTFDAFHDTIVRVKRVYPNGSPGFDHPASATGGDATAGMWRRATPAEIADHKAKEEQRAKEDERAKKLSALKWSTRVQTPKGEGLFLSMDDPKEEAWVAVKDEGDCSWFELDLITIID